MKRITYAAAAALAGLICVNCLAIFVQWDVRWFWQWSDEARLAVLVFVMFPLAIAGAANAPSPRPHPKGDDQ